jgi:hypothetical protein
MKKTVKKMSLHRETLHGLTGEPLPNQAGQLVVGGGVSVPSCVDGCASVMVVCPH